MVTSLHIECATLELLRDRSPTQSICPSEVARLLAKPPADWRELMPAIRKTAVRLALKEQVVITQGLTILDPNTLAAGPIRLRRGTKFSPS